MKRQDPTPDSPMWNDPNEAAYVRDLLQAGRNEGIDYDVSAGLVKHMAHVQAGTALPHWAQTTGASSGSAWLGWVVMPIVAATAATGVWLATREAPEQQPRPAVAKVAQLPETAPVSSVIEAAPVQPTAAVEPTLAEPGVAARIARSEKTPVAKLRANEHVAAKSAPSETFPRATPSAQAHSASSAQAVDAIAMRERAQPTAAAREAQEPVAEQEKQATVAQPEKHQSESQLEREMQMLVVAQRVLANDPARALKLAEQGEREFPRTMFSAERKQLSLLALVKLGRLEEARRIGQPFLAKYPNAPWSARLKRALATGRVE